MTDKKANIIGWTGTILFVIAYALVSFEILQAKGIIYQALNMTGALGIGIQGWQKNAKAIVILEGFWIAIGIMALAKANLL